MLKRLFHRIVTLLICILMLLSALWAALAIFTSDRLSEVIRTGALLLVALLAIGCLLGAAKQHWRWRAVGIHLLTFTAVLLWWQSSEPSNERQWQRDVAVLPYATLVGNQVTLHNIRQFKYRSETDFTPAYYEQQFDLDKLEGIDLIASYWMGPAVAHVFLSFSFSDGKHVAMSIETRKEVGENYSTLLGFFRKYELYYVVANEEDVVKLRTNYRRDPPEDVYLYRLTGTAEGNKKLFLEYVDQINALKDQPAFYNSLTTNCTTNIWLNSRVNNTHLPMHWKILASGYVPEYLHEHQRLLPANKSFAEQRRLAHINARALLPDSKGAYSERIRNPNLISPNDPAPTFGKAP